MSNLDIQIDQKDTHTIVRLTGEADIVTYKSLMDVTEKLAALKPAIVVVDLSNLTFLNSLALGALVKLRAELKHSNGSLRLAALQPSVQEALSKSRLHWIIPIFPTVEMALVSQD